MTQSTPEQKINVIPELLNFFAMLQAEQKKLGNDLRIVSGHRTAEQQQELYNLGRDKNGKVINKKLVVTNAKPGMSRHNASPSQAIDIGFFKEGVSAKGFLDSASFRKWINNYLERFPNIEWGGNFLSLNDYVHFQIKKKVN